MRTFSFSSTPRKLLIGASVALVSAVLLSVYCLLPPLPDETATPLMMIDRLFDVWLVGVFTLGAVGVGRWLLRKLSFSFHSALAESVLAFGVGAGVFSHGLLLLGLAHLLSGPLVLFLLVVVVGLTAKEWSAAGLELLAEWRTRARLTRLERALVCGLALLIAPVFLGALAPPTEGDALTYQLAAPALFLERHAVLPVLENTGANYPLGTGLLFVFGLAAASPIAAQLTHFLFGLALMVAIYGLARDNFGRPAGLLAGAIYWTSPVIGLEANAPLLDLGWVFYEFLAIWMFWEWHQTRSRRTLILMATFLGFAMSSKYLALVGLGTLILFVMVDVLVTYRRAWIVIESAIIVGGVAVVVASPWYLKNQIWLGNPVYPFFGGAYGLDGQIHKPTSAAIGLAEWVGAGMGTDLGALLLFPYNVYVHWQSFDPVKNRGGPSLLFWFLPFYLIVPKRPLITLLFLIAAIRFGVWWNLTQFVRYGLILFPLLSVICGYIIWRLLERVNGRWGYPLLQVVVALALIVGILLQWGFLFFLHEGSIGFLLGAGSRAAYLDTNLNDYRAMIFINAALPANATIFAVGDTRIFYARRRVIGDVGHTNWAELTAWGRTAEGVRDRLRDLQVTHVWVSDDEITYSRNFWNIPEPWRDPVVPFPNFRDCCLERVYADERGHSIYALRDSPRP